MSRVNIFISDELFEATEREVTAEGLKRSQFIAKVMREYLDRQKLLRQAARTLRWPDE